MNWLSRLFRPEPKPAPAEGAKAPRKAQAAPKPPVRKKIFELAGEASTDASGYSPQTALLDASPGDFAALVREPANPYDPNAIRVDDASGRRLGYIARADAAVLAPILDSGSQPKAKVHRLSGGFPTAPTYGCEVSLMWAEHEPHKHRAMDQEQLDFRKQLQRKARR